MISFRCIRCQHAVQTSNDAVGQKMYCPVCYLELTVPAKSTVKPIDESQLYVADRIPVDVREMEQRKSIVSLRCPVCHTNIAVSGEQIGTEVVCPECETEVFVPNSIAQKIDRSLADKITSGFADTNIVSNTKTYEIYGSDSAEPRNVGTIRVYCKLCGTMMYASDDQIGTEIVCPDCETKNIVPPRLKRVTLPPPLPTVFEGGATFGVKDGAKDSVKENTNNNESLVSEPLVPVVCSLCGTRMYAQENEIGGVKTCPDCGIQTEIKAVPKTEMIQPVISPGGGYGINSEEVPVKRPVFQTLIDYRYVEGSLDKKLYDVKIPEPKKPQTLPIFPILYDPEPESRRPPKAKPDKTETDSVTDSITARERLTVKKAGFDADHYLVQKIQRTPLPKHPFWTRIFVPFTNLRLWGLTIAASICGMMGFVVGSLLPGLWFLFSIPFDFIVLMLGLSLIANTCQSLFLWTTAGNDLPEKDDWQEFRLLESGSFAVWLFFLVILASSPGYLLASGLTPQPAIPEPVTTPQQSGYVQYFLLELGSCLFLFPIFFLSSMESGSYFVILAKATSRSLLDCTGIWLRFYFISLLLAAFFCAMIGLISIITRDHLFAGLAAVIPVGSVFSLLYARFLGRLGWTLEEWGRSEES